MKFTKVYNLQIILLCYTQTWREMYLSLEEYRKQRRYNMTNEPDIRMSFSEYQQYIVHKSRE